MNLGTIVWIFYNVIPWFWLITTILYFIVVIAVALTRDKYDYYDRYYGAWDFVTEYTIKACLFVGIIGVLITALAAFLIENGLKLLKSLEKRVSSKKSRA